MSHLITISTHIIMSNLTSLCAFCFLFLSFFLLYMQNFIIMKKKRNKKLLLSVFFWTRTKEKRNKTRNKICIFLFYMKKKNLWIKNLCANRVIIRMTSIGRQVFITILLLVMWSSIFVWLTMSLCIVEHTTEFRVEKTVDMSTASKNVWIKSGFSEQKTTQFESYFYILEKSSVLLHLFCFTFFRIQSIIIIKS